MFLAKIWQFIFFVGLGELTKNMTLLHGVRGWGGGGGRLTVTFEESKCKWLRPKQIFFLFLISFLFETISLGLGEFSFR